MSRADEVYNYSKTLERELSKLKAGLLGEENSRVVLEFHSQLVAEGISIARRIKYLQTIRSISSLLKKQFSEVTKEDIVEFVGTIEQRNYSEWTKRDYKLLLKRFYKWFRKWDEGYPPEVKWIKIRGNFPNKLRKEDLLTVEEVESIVKAASNLRDKAFLWLYFESMRRLGEILNLNIGDVEFDDLGARLRVDGKMGPDDGRVVFSAPILSNWLEIHPLRDDPHAPLWIAMDSKKRNIRRLTYPAARNMFKDCAERAGIKKRVWLYLIRHSRITPASKVLPHALLCRTAGWKQGSRMPQVYIHLSGEDLDDAHRILNGITEETRQCSEKIMAVGCKRCFSKNVPGSKFCARCGSPLSLEAAIQVDDARKKADMLMTELVKRPEIMDHLLEAIAKMRE